jgi:hypothetical protein
MKIRPFENWHGVSVRGVRPSAAQMLSIEIEFQRIQIFLVKRDLTAL